MKKCVFAISKVIDILIWKANRPSTELANQTRSRFVSNMTLRPLRAAKRHYYLSKPYCIYRSRWVRIKNGSGSPKQPTRRRDRECSTSLKKVLHFFTLCNNPGPRIDQLENVTHVSDPARKGNAGVIDWCSDPIITSTCRTLCLKVFT